MEIDGTKRQSFIVGVWGVEPDGVIWARPLMIWEIIIDTLKTSLPGRRAFMSLLPFLPPPPPTPPRDMPAPAAELSQLRHYNGWVPTSAGVIGS